MSYPDGTPITTSQSPALSVFRTNPRRCGHHVYSRRACMSLASIDAIRFSKPCCRLSEKGRLLGSEQTRSASRWAVGDGRWALLVKPAIITIKTAHRPAPSPQREPQRLKRKDIQRPSHPRLLLEIRHRARDA